MKIYCDIDSTDSEKRKLEVENAEGYNEVILRIKEYDNSGWKIIGEITISGRELEKAVANAMND